MTAVPFRAASAAFALGLFLGSYVLGGLAAPASAQLMAKPLAEQPAEGAVSPGLEVRYYYHLFRHIDELISWQDYKDGKPGPIIERLNYRVGQGTVLTSSSSDGVGAEITGLIKLDTAGTYAFALHSNDGVRLWIGGEELVDDPGVHADQFSDIGEISVETPGWYPLKLLYFERKNTSTLELHWRRPGDAAGTMPVVPAEVLGHLSSQ